MLKMNNKVQPIAFDTLSDEEFDELMDQAMIQYTSGTCTSVEEFESELTNEFDSCTSEKMSLGI